MAKKSRRSQEGFISENESNTAPTIDGEIKVHADAHKVRLNGVVRCTVNLDEDQTLTNKNIDGWENDVDNITSTFPVNQVGHGFAIGDGIYHDGATWVKGQANDADTLAYFIVIEVVDVDNFRGLDFGRIQIPAHGFTIGEYYFLSETTPGLPVTSIPNIGYSNPLFFVEDANILQVKLLRPDAVGSGTTLDQLDDVSVNSPANNEVLTYNNGTGLWEAAPAQGAPGSGEANTNTNVGGFVEVAKPKSGVDTPLRTIQSSDSSLVISQNTDDIDIKQTFASYIPVDMIDLTLTTLPTGVPVIDDITVVDGSEVLFTNLTVGNNRVYIADLVTTPGNVIWTDLYGTEFEARRTVAVSDGTIAGSDIYVHDDGGGWSWGIRGVIKPEDITNQTTVTPASGDYVIITDASDSNALKKVNVDDFAITSSDITSKTEVTGAAGDYVLITDASDSDNLKKVDISTLGGGSLVDPVTIISGTDIDFNDGHYFRKSLSANDTFTLSNVPVSGSQTIVVALEAGAGTRTVTFPVGVRWNNNTPVATIQAGYSCVYTFVTFDGTIYATAINDMI